jgi:hypothetical protein
MTYPNVTDAGTAGPEIDDEPLLIRPYVRLVEHQHAAHVTEEPLGGASTSDGQPEYARTPADIRPTRAGAAPATAAPPVNRFRRRFVTVGSGMLMVAVGATVLALSATVLALSAGDEPAAPAPGAAGSTAPAGRLFGTAAVPAPPSSPVSNAAATARVPSVSGEPSLPGASPNPAGAAPPIDGPALGGQPTLPPPRGGEVSTGPITSVSGLCLDGNVGPNGDGIRRWDCNGTSGQAWTVADGGTIQALGRCLQASGDQVRLRDCDGGPAQQWRSGLAGSLVNPASGLCLGGPGDADSRAPQRMVACNQSDAQRWILP